MGIWRSCESDSRGVNVVEQACNDYRNGSITVDASKLNSDQLWEVLEKSGFITRNVRVEEVVSPVVELTQRFINKFVSQKKEWGIQDQSVNPLCMALI